MAAALARADLVLAIGTPEVRERWLAGWPVTAPVLAAELAPLTDWQWLDAVAFAGIVRPERFFAKALGVRLHARIALDDHQPLPESLMRRVEAEAGGRPLVTTEKDAVRLPPAWRARVLVLPVRLIWSDLAPLERFLERLGR